jgi:hypothetical protein
VSQDGPTASLASLGMFRDFQVCCRVMIHENLRIEFIQKGDSGSLVLLNPNNLVGRGKANSRKWVTRWHL